MELDIFLSYARPTSDLRTLILNYTPHQTPLAYNLPNWAKSVLTELGKMVRYSLFPTKGMQYISSLGLRRQR